MTVKVFSKPRCPQCDATKRKLTKLNIPFETIDVTLDAEALEHVTNLGYQQVPVVETKTSHWSGYRPDLLQGLVAERRAA